MFPMNAVLKSDSEEEETYECKDEIKEAQIDDSCEESFLKIPVNLRSFWPFLFTNFPKCSSPGVSELEITKFNGRDQNIEELVFKSDADGFVCRLCRKTCTKITPLLRHMKIIHGIRRPYICRHCGRRIRDYGTLYQHAKNHAKPRSRDMFSLEDFLAGTIDAYLSRQGISTDLNASRLKKNALEQYECIVCQAAFEKVLPAFSHLQEAHLIASPYTCFVCNMDFKGMQSLYSHSLLKHSNAQPQNKCDLCGKAYYNLSSLKDHVITHTALKSFTCGICSKGYTRKRDLTRHQRSIHNGEGTVECQICGKVCSQNWNLKLHMKTHQTQA